MSRSGSLGKFRYRPLGRGELSCGMVRQLGFVLVGSGQSRNVPVWQSRQVVVRLRKFWKGNEWSGAVRT